MSLQYRNHNLTKSPLDPHYMKHVSAMTTEELHSKSDIAAELAFRDQQIDNLKNLLQMAWEAVQEAGYEGHSFELKKKVEELI